MAEEDDDIENLSAPIRVWSFPEHGRIEVKVQRDEPVMLRPGDRFTINWAVSRDLRLVKVGSAEDPMTSKLAEAGTPGPENRPPYPLNEKLLDEMMALQHQLQDRVKALEKKPDPVATAAEQSFNYWYERLDNRVSTLESTISRLGRRVRQIEIVLGNLSISIGDLVFKDEE